MFTVPDIGYSYDALEPFIDEETMRIHHTKHHAAYVKNLNDTLTSYPQYENQSIEQILRLISHVPSEIRQKVINFGGGHANHVVFWNSLSSVHSQKPKGELEKEIIREFSSVESCIDMFKKTALSRFASGWAWLVLDKKKVRIIDTQNQDSPLSLGMIPLLGLDVWEHAYYLKYRSSRAEYIEALFHVINWDRAEKTYKKNIAV